MIHSEQYKPDPEQCCSACVFGQGRHAKFCIWHAELAEVIEFPRSRVEIFRRDERGNRIPGPVELAPAD